MRKKKPQKRGPKPKIGDAERKQIITVVTMGGSIADAAGYLGIGSRTVRDHMAQNAKFRIGIYKARKSAKLRLIQKVGKASQWQAAAWMLERQYGREYGRKDRQEITGRNGGPIQNEHRGNFSFAEFLADLARARSEGAGRLPAPNGN